MIQVKKIEPFVCEAFDPDDNSLGFLNDLELNDLRIQIIKEEVSGYYLIFEDQKICIRTNGVIDRYPKGFYDQREKQLYELIRLRTKHTSKEWQDIYPNPKVLDPDGWDRENFKYSWFQEHISYHEYQRRVSLSTCMHKKD